MPIVEGGGPPTPSGPLTTEDEVRAALARLGYQVTSVSFVQNPAYTATNDEPRMIPQVTVAGAGDASAARAISDAIGGGTVSFAERQGPAQPQSGANDLRAEQPLGQGESGGGATGTTADGGGSAGPAGGGAGVTGGGGGGGGGAPSGGGGGGAARSPVDVPDDQLEETVRRLYGYLAVFLDHPELGPIIKQAAREGWSQERIKGAINETEWWQTTSQTAREWEVLKAEDPATANQRLDARTEQLTEAAQRFGADVDQSVIRGLAETSIRLGWDQDQIDEALLNEAQSFGAGQVRFTAEQLTAAASDYLVPLSEPAAQDWAERIARGEATSDGFTSYLREQAASLFSGNQSIQNALERGQTVRQWADPYVQMAAQTLEQNPRGIDLSQPKYRRMIHQIAEEGGGTPMSLAEAQTYLRSLPDWQGTRQATEQAAELTENLARKMGMA